MALARGKDGRPRRTQAERRAATRLSLLDATIDCLVEFGYAGVTTTRVVERAGVSRGAQVHHFATKAELVASAVAHLADRRSQEMLAQVNAFGEGAPRLDAVLDLLWQAHRGPLFQAAMELWVAGRTDPELRRQLATVEREVSAAILRHAPELLADYAAAPSFGGDVDLALATMRGLAIQSTVTESSAVDRRWREARKRLKQIFEEHAAAGRDRPRAA